MTQLEKLETTLDDALNKNAPFKIPANGRKSLAEAMWWLALIGGVLQLWLAWGFWHVGHLVDRLIGYTNALSSYYGGDVVSNHLGLFYYLTLVVVLISAVLLLVATPSLKAMRKQGWNLVFYSTLVNVAYGVVRMFTDYGGFGDLIGAIIGSIIGAYLLFQVRDHFMKSSMAHREAK
jgi:hypothetical protein